MSVCEHGQLERQCLVCELQAEVERLKLECCDLARSNADYAHGIKYLQEREAKWRELVSYVEAYRSFDDYARIALLRSELMEIK